MIVAASLKLPPSFSISCGKLEEAATNSARAMTGAGANLFL